MQVFAEIGTYISLKGKTVIKAPECNLVAEDAKLYPSRRHDRVPADISYTL